MTGHCQGMTFGEFNAMMSKRDPAGHAKLTPLPEEQYHLVEALTPVCAHPFNTLGLRWSAKRAEGSVTVIVEYRCTECHEIVGTARRRIRLS